MKRVRLAAVRRCGQGVFLVAFLAATPLFAAPKKSKEPSKPSAHPAGVAPKFSAQPVGAQSPPADSSDLKPAPVQASDDLYEGPVTKRPKTLAPASVPSDGKIEAPRSAGPRFADAWASEYRKPEADLLLAPSGNGRAQAMAEYVRGLHADKRGDADVALESWKRAASLDPENADLTVKVAFELAKRNEPGEAIRILKDSIAAAPKEPRTHIYLAQIYARHLNKMDFALASAQKAIDMAPEDFRGWEAVYDLYQQSGDQKKATDLLDRALKSSIKEADFWLRLGRKLSLKANGKPSADELRQMEFAYRRAAELKPGDASVLTQAGDFFVIARDHKQALSFFERAMKLNQAPNDEITKNLPEKYADLLLKEGRISDAVAVLEKMAADSRQTLRTDLYERLGDLYEQAGQIDKAVEHYRQTLVLDTVEPRNHVRLAQVLLRAKRYDELVQVMEAARKRFKNEPGTTLVYAQFLSIAKRHDQALAMYEAAADELRGRNEGLLTSTFLESWAAAAERGGKFDQAVELLKKSIADFPDKPGAYNDLGYLWVERGINLEEAGDMIKKAIEMDPKNAAYLDSLGWYYFKTGKYEDAKRELLNALNELSKDDPTILDHLGDACDKLNLTKEAVQHWERALKLEPEQPEKMQEKIAAGKKKLGV